MCPAILESETQRIGKQIISEIRRSPEILLWNTNTISFISAINKDTVTYSFEDGILLRNHEPVHPNAYSAKVTTFSLSQTSDIGTAGISDKLLELNIGISNLFNDSSSTRMKVTVHAPPQDVKKVDWGSGN
jgi:hypothetical protein